MATQRSTQALLLSLVLGLSILFALLVGTGAGVLTAAAGSTIPSAALLAGGAFGSTLALCVLIINMFRRS